MSDERVSLAHGSGGTEMNELIKKLGLSFRGDWKGFDDDSASIKLENGEELFFTTDSYVVDPLFFGGGDIGKIAVCGTINDLLVQGANPLGISLSLVLEEGLPIKTLDKIMSSIRKVSEETKIPIVTGDTKVMEKNKVDKIIINTSGVGLGKTLNQELVVGDKIIISGGLGEHAVALLAKRFDYETSIVSDSKALVKELESIRSDIKLAKDITRGGLASILNDVAQKQSVGLLISEELIPAKKEVKRVTEILGIDLYSLACEGRLVCVANKDKAERVIEALRKFNKDAAVIGEVTQQDAGKVFLQTIISKRLLPTPSGRIVPRIC
ncbi:hydrogenase expression/formation protein HypE [Candidatus Woesearchaeota archaeon]|nr:hydrogenase expression/formation protein HypE [Candidatus Woesearchaeota archaeon]